jgi:hypothetical protein
VDFQGNNTITEEDIASIFNPEDIEGIDDGESKHL